MMLILIHDGTNPTHDGVGVVGSGAGRVLHLDRGGVSLHPLPRLPGKALLIISARVAELQGRTVWPDEDSDCDSSCDWE